MGRKIGAHTHTHTHTEPGIITGGSGKPEGTVGLSDLSVEDAWVGLGCTEKEVDSRVGPPLTNTAFTGWPELTLS